MSSHNARNARSAGTPGELPEYISLGAGVQSSTLALMAAHHEITPMPRAAVFADTRAEPAAVYQWLARLETLLPFPVYHCSAGDLREHIRKTNRLPIPAFLLSTTGRPYPANRSCTRDFKLVPIAAQLRTLEGLTNKRPRKPRLRQWIGISLDEAARMKPSRTACFENRWPLIELRMTRNDCKQWLTRHGYPVPPKSSCTFCPYHDDKLWQHLRATDPHAWAEATAIDTTIRHKWRGRTPSDAYLHRSLTPLAGIDWGLPRKQLNLWINECEGMCGL